MTAPVKHIIQNNTFWLSPQRCLFWEEQEALILSDLHFGKTGHFRKNGIAVPQKVFTEDIQRLIEQIAYFKPRQVIAVGDLFHSEANKELDLFLKWRNDFPGIDFILVKGNHDILEKTWYTNAGIKVYEGLYSVSNFDFLHDPSDTTGQTVKSNFIFSGHIHPGVNIQGLAKQNLQFPCYYFASKLAILPAFSKFSGLAMVKKRPNETIYAIVNQSLVKIR
jgi:DNA ligase-associated metallophosphoesterase